MDGCLNNFTDIPTYPKVNGQPIVSLTELSVYQMVGGVMDHKDKVLPSLNMGRGEELLTPLGGQLYQPV